MPASVRAIIREVAAAHGVAVGDLLSRSVIRKTAAARHAAMQAVRARVVIYHRPPSMPQIGVWFGRDHTSVVYALKKLGPPP
jgi:chromosomal replication initiation ATPase DnaA